MPWMPPGVRAGSFGAAAPSASGEAGQGGGPGGVIVGQTKCGMFRMDSSGALLFKPKLRALDAPPAAGEAAAAGVREPVQEGGPN